MKRETEAEFEALAQKVSGEAAEIECSPAAYREGLRLIISTLNMDIQANLETSGDEDDD